jgi:hypothetical protein
VEPWKSGSHDQNEVVLGAVADAAERYALAGYVTIIAGITLPGWFYEPLRDRLQVAGIDRVTVILRPSLAICRRRAEGRSSSPLADPAVVEQLWRGFTDIGSSRIASSTMANRTRPRRQTPRWPPFRDPRGLGGHHRLPTMWPDARRRVLRLLAEIDAK